MQQSASNDPKPFECYQNSSRTAFQFANRTACGCFKATPKYQPEFNNLVEIIRNKHARI